MNEKSEKNKYPVYYDDVYDHLYVAMRILKEHAGTDDTAYELYRDLEALLDRVPDEEDYDE